MLVRLGAARQGQRARRLLWVQRVLERDRPPGLRLQAQQRDLPAAT